MKKNNLFLAATMLALGGLLAACGTSETEQNGAEETPQETAPAEETTETPVETEEPEEEPEEAEIAEEELSKAEAEGQLTESDEQQYKIYVLPGFQLTAEEPNKDALLWEEDSAVFMRIETFTKTDIEFAQAEAAMKEALAASNPDAEMAETAAPQGAEILTSVAYEIPTAEGKVTGIVYEKEDLIVRLTVFDSSAVNATADFIDMGGTIERP
jgi:ABC-type oligopeptide transport system substrate-binding subunit